MRARQVSIGGQIVAPRGVLQLALSGHETGGEKEAGAITLVPEQRLPIVWAAGLVLEGLRSQQLHGTHVGRARAVGTASWGTRSLDQVNIEPWQASLDGCRGTNLGSWAVLHNLNDFGVHYRALPHDVEAIARGSSWRNVSVCDGVET